MEQVTNMKCSKYMTLLMFSRICLAVVAANVKAQLRPLDPIGAVKVTFAPPDDVLSATTLSSAPFRCGNETHNRPAAASIAVIRRGCSG